MILLMYTRNGREHLYDTQFDNEEEVIEYLAQQLVDYVCDIPLELFSKVIDTENSGIHITHSEFDTKILARAEELV